MSEEHKAVEEQEAEPQSLGDIRESIQHLMQDHYGVTAVLARAVVQLIGLVEGKSAKVAKDKPAPASAERK